MAQIETIRLGSPSLPEFKELEHEVAMLRTEMEDRDTRQRAAITSVRGLVQTAAVLAITIALLYGALIVLMLLSRL